MIYISTLYNDFDVPIEDIVLPANGDVYAITNYDYEDEFELEYYEKEYTGNTEKSFHISLFGKYITINKYNAKYKNYDIIENENIFKLGKTYSLPFGYKNNISKEYKLLRKTYSKDEAISKADNKIDLYIEQLKARGVFVEDINISTIIEDNKVYSNGKIICKELIGVPEKLDFKLKKEYSQEE